MVDLPKGGNTSVVGPVIRSTLQTRLAPGDIEICALLVDEQRKARSEAWKQVFKSWSELAEAMVKVQQDAFASMIGAANTTAKGSQRRRSPQR